MREVGENKYRVSLRSKGDINVARVAEKFGGGGHANAAGCSVEGDWDQTEAEIVNRLRIEINQFDINSTDAD